ncbi:MAG: hypothetical protein KDJ54_01270 [Candidatus Competibacteraceae bacterium]|nr:hypothetical protein [Candidatus Competibacteraceae bacterium]
MNPICKSLLPALLFGSGVVSLSSVWAGDMVLVVEEPLANHAYSGVANIRGWVVGSAGIDRVELYVDGALLTPIPTGGRRSDVGDAYPNYPNAANAGFSMAFNYSSLLAGPHAILIRATDREGAFKEAAVDFNVTRFPNAYIPDPASVNLSGASATFDSRSFLLKNVTAEGKTYDIRLEWRREAQGFAITRISTAGDPPADDYSGTYHSQASQSSNSCPFAVSQQVKSELQLNQTGSQLSGTENSGGTLAVSGTVDAQGQFSLQSERLTQTPSANCRGETYFGYQGDFPSQTVTITTHYEYFGSCPYYNCAATYQGGIVRDSAATLAEEASADSGSKTKAMANSAARELIESVLETFEHETP